MPEDLYLKDFAPRPTLVSPEHHVPRPRFPLIEAHTHLGRKFGEVEPAVPVDELLATMDTLDVRAVVDADGGWGEEVLAHRLDYYKAAAPERFVCLGGVPWEGWADHPHDFGEWAAARVEAQVRRGAQGLKVWKVLGLTLRDPAGRLVPVDDMRLDPIWARAGELGVPILIHVGDPVAFFQPLDRFNERYEELQHNPDWHFYGPEFPPFERVIEGLANVVARHPGTVFIGAHVGCYAENLGWVGALMDRASNFFADISARIAELGRQPYTARRFFLEHADRILFGTDMIPSPATYAVHFRFLETWDEHFAYHADETQPPGQGRWRIYGLGLPDEVLEKVYFSNAARLFGVRTAGPSPA
jgi:predicted TIM-barrel fold metal-dependent hydrolase